MAEGAREGGAEFETIVLAEKSVMRCLGCEACQSEDGRRPCVLEGKDDARSILEAMRQADILVFATPVYIFAMSSLLKALLERINSECDRRDLRASKSGLVFHQVDPGLCSKPFVVLAPFGNIETETPRNVVEYFISYSRFMDAPMLAALPRSGAFIIEKASKSEAVSRTPIASVLEAFRAAGFELARRGAVTHATIRRATRSVTPMPLFARALMSIRPLRGRLIAAAKASGALRMN